MNLSIIKKSIQRWNQVRNTELGLTFLTSGFGFEVYRSEYEQWQKIVGDAKASIHLYIGILEFETVFFVIDSISDAKGDYRLNENLFYKSFTKDHKKNASSRFQAFNGGLPETEAMQRTFKWFSDADAWFAKKMNYTGREQSLIARAFTIPYEDLDLIFSTKETSKTLLFFGLKDYYDDKKLLYKDEIEVLLCSETHGFTGYKDNRQFADVTTPIPPFSDVNKNLNLF